MTSSGRKQLMRAFGLTLMTATVQFILVSCGLGGFAACQAVIPAELPSGASVGSPVEGVAGGAKQFVWGAGRDLVDLRVGLSYKGAGDPGLEKVLVRGNNGAVFEIVPGYDQGLGLTWSEGGCDYTAFFDPGMDASSIAEYASRY